MKKQYEEIKKEHKKSEKKLNKFQSSFLNDDDSLGDVFMDCISLDYSFEDFMKKINKKRKNK